MLALIKIREESNSILDFMKTAKEDKIYKNAHQD